jgi:putative tryptophan/tyrosine transport system substrate-binding protein
MHQAHTVYGRPRPFSVLASWVLVIVLTAGCWLGGTPSAQAETPSRIAVVVSEPIKPYLDAVSSFQEVMKKRGGELSVFVMEGEGSEAPDRLKKELASGNFGIGVSVGPQATEFLWAEEVPGEFSRIFGMVLNPEEIIGHGCGVPMNIPVLQQVHAVQDLLPSFNRIGILYDPRYNAQFVQEATAACAETHVKIIPVTVQARDEIRGVLERTWNGIDALWLIPDFTVISESVVRYVIKEGLANKKPVIGYNRFFFHSGAALSFILDYGRIGEQMAFLCREVQEGRACISPPPPFEVWLNSRALQILDIKAPAKAVPDVKVMP